MNTCETCKHWRSLDTGHSIVPNIGECTFVVQYWDATDWDWDNDDSPRALREEYKDRLAFTQDGSDYRADLLTLPNFGCVQHEAK